jgi:hypothetical protein
MPLLLTDSDRRTFIEWLENEVATTDEILIQMEKIRAPEVMMQQFRAEVAAARIILHKLKSIHTDTIGGR